MRMELLEAIMKGDVLKFYKSMEWLDKRTDILERDNNECQKHKARGKFHSAECVHHKEHLRDRPDLALTDSNLISLCNSCHNEEHPEKFNNKPKAQLNEERW
ncbi:HNH endonuclease [Clostridium amylolyticum]|uniref:Putative HNH nuclease YajD n=2 Tax=Clostridium amylolyticum TaxID=1121298 RepID=A0A1M6L003_9CLOT|nr:HNH endonuclease [Clostridium amylolyticum]